jgi:hypothetical protein
MTTFAKKGRVVGHATLPENLLAVADGVHGETFLNPTGHSSQAATSSAARPQRAHIGRDIRRPSTIFWICLQAQPGVNAVHNLRGLLKIALRRFGLRCLALREVRR